MNLIYDERPGMVAVYEEPQRDCLEMPADTFVFVRHWERRAEGGWNRVEADCVLAKLIAAAPELLSAARHALPVVASGGSPMAAAIIRDAIEKAELG